MKFLKVCLIVVASLLFIGGAGYLYASGGVKSKPGYAELVAPQGASIDAIVSVKLGPGGVGPARWIAEKIAATSGHEFDVSEQAFADVLGELNGIQVRVYEVHNNRQAFDTAIAKSVAGLKEKNWQTLATVREDEERVVVMHTGTDTHIDGVSVMVSNSENAVFVNLIGPFDSRTVLAAANHMH